MKNRQKCFEWEKLYEVLKKKLKCVNSYVSSSRGTTGQNLKQTKPEARKYQYDDITSDISVSERSNTAFQHVHCSAVQNKRNTVKACSRTLI